MSLEAQLSPQGAVKSLGEPRLAGDLECAGTARKGCCLGSRVSADSLM